MTLLDRIGHHRADLTESERHLAAFLVARYPHIVFESATAIGQQVGVSIATVVRFFSKLGYDSFADVQRELREEIAARLHSPIQRLDAKADEPGDVDDIVNRSLEVDLGNLQTTYRGLDRAQLRALVDRLLAERGRTYVIGEKKAYGVAHYLHTQLNMALPNVELLESGQSLLVDRLLGVQANDLLIAVDVRRYARATVLAGRCFHEAGAEVAVLADSPLSPLSALATYRLLATTAGAAVFDSYTAPLSVANALVNVVAARRTEALHATLERGEALWQAFQTFTARDVFGEGYPKEPGRGGPRRG